MELNAYLTAAKTLSTLQNFITDGGLLQTLELLGDVQFESAIEALKNIRVARDPGREVALAVGHLQAAHIAFRKIWQPSNKLKLHIQHDAIRVALGHGQQTELLMALCYCFLKEPHLLEQCIAQAKECDSALVRYNEMGSSPLFLLGFLNAKNYAGPHIPKMLNKVAIEEVASALRKIS